jgi:integrase
MRGFLRFWGRRSTTPGDRSTATRPSRPRGTASSTATPTNNALATLAACLNDATRKGKLVRNPAARIQRPPSGHLECDYLRLDEITGRLAACSATYRPLAELLIATGLPISEALGLTWADVDFDNGAIRVLRSRKRGGVGSTKGNRFRSVDVRPRRRSSCAT